MRPKEYPVKLFPSGKKVTYKDQIYTVDHVRVYKGDLFIKFVELPTEINSEEIDCKPTVLVLK